MISLEQVQLLEERVSKAVDYVKRVKAENTALTAEKAALIQKMEANQKRIDELEVHVLRFKEDQGRIEDGIIAALDRLSQFEEAFENSLKDDKTTERKSSPKMYNDKPAENNEYFEITDNAEDASSDVSEDTSAEAELDIF
ncbi:MAG: cell division protein ZapB [Treponema sp.]|jgi:FtsZ-binding cell division protein ZapB|nr:cell division protein ZapB [Treponema sp.]